MVKKALGTAMTLHGIIVLGLLWLMSFQTVVFVRNSRNWWNIPSSFHYISCKKEILTWRQKQIKTDTNRWDRCTETDETDVQTETDKTDAQTETDKSDIQTETDKIDAQTETDDQTDVQTETDV